MRISDWSSDVCSSDLIELRQHGSHFPVAAAIGQGDGDFDADVLRRRRLEPVPELAEQIGADDAGAGDLRLEAIDHALFPRSEERRVGKECVSTCRSRWLPYT